MLKAMSFASRNSQPDNGAGDMIDRLASRIAVLRKERGLARRALSELSGVSPRYLALLEAGTGNISVLLLHRIATALGVTIDSLLSEDGPRDLDTEQIAALYQNAPASVQSKVRSLLAPQDPATVRAQRICLIGLRGAGKTTLGKLAAEALDVPFVDLTQEIEQAADMPLAEVLAFYGEAGYRKMEADALERVGIRHDRLILSVAGGIVAEEKTYSQLLERFHAIWIRTSPDEHIQRVRAPGDNRQIKNNAPAMEQLKTLIAVRTPLYAKAEAQLNTAGTDVQASLDDLLQIITKHGFLGSAP